jgi:response regulator RpfG family c-di-GMP phosphodiesterase
MNECKHTILCVDDEINILNSLKRLFRKEGYCLLTASSGFEALKMVEENNGIHLVISDQRMPGMNGTEFLAKVREKYPDIFRIVLTGYTDIDAITESINEGHIYKFILKPWNDQNLVLDIRQCLDQYELREANTSLHKKILQQNEELKRINENLEIMVKERTAALNLQNSALELSRAILEDVPLPVIGVSKEMLIVVINLSAQSIIINDKRIEVGKRISNYFPDEIVNKVNYVISYNRRDQIWGYKLSDEIYNVVFAPASGSFSGKGAVITFIPA